RDIVSRALRIQKSPHEEIKKISDAEYGAFQTKFTKVDSHKLSYLNRIRINFKHAMSHLGFGSTRRFKVVTSSDLIKQFDSVFNMKEKRKAVVERDLRRDAVDPLEPDPRRKAVDDKEKLK